MRPLPRNARGGHLDAQHATIELPPALRPTHARHWVVFFAVTLAVITYVDRICVSQAGPLIKQDLGFTDRQLGQMYSAFFLAYSIFEIPGGWLGDKIGPRRVLMRVVVMWSFFTAATGWVRSFWSMIVCRFLFGAGEAGCFPNLTKAFTIWLPRTERTRAQGIMWLSARWGGAFTPMLVVWMMTLMPWWRTFWVFGAVGMIWAVAFYLWFRDDPATHPSVNRAELSLLDGAAENAAGSHVRVPWAKLLRSRTVCLLWIQYALISYSWAFYISWLPTYLQKSRGLEPGRAAFLNTFLLFFGGIGCMLSGPVAGWVSRHIGTYKARRRIAYVGLSGAAACVLAYPRVQDPTYAMLLLGLSNFCQDIMMPNCWGVCMDVGGRYAGSMSGGMNMVGNIGSFLSPIVVGEIITRTGGNYEPVFWVAGAVYLLGALCWTMIDPVTPIEIEGSEPPGLPQASK